MLTKSFFRSLVVAGLLASGAPVGLEAAEQAPVAVPAASELQKLEDMLYQTYLHNPALRAARADLKAIEQRLPQARAGWLPTVSAGGSVVASDVEGGFFGGGDTTSKDINASVNQPLFKGGRTAASVDSAKGLIAAQEALVLDTQQSILLRAATVYMDVLRDQALLTLSAATRKAIAEQLEASQKRFAVGEVTRTDVAQSEARYARADADWIRAQGNLESSKAAFEQVVGIRPEKLGQPRLNFPLPETVDELFTQVESYNPRIRAATHLHESAQGDVGKVFGEFFPELNLSGSWDRDYDPSPGLVDETTSKSIGIVATIPIYTGGATLARVREARHTANRRLMNVMDTRLSAREEAVRNWEALKTARAEIVSREAQVRAATLAREGVRQEAAIGTRTILDSLDADQEYQDARAALVTARRNEIVATFQLAATLGLLNADILGFSVAGEGAGGREKAGDGYE